MVDRDLVERCRRGDRKAQHELYASTSDRMYRILFRITGRQEDALDLSQEAYFRAFTRINQFDGRSSFFTWLCRIAVNEALQFLRREGTARTNHETAAAQARTKGGAAHSDTKLDIDAALAELTPEERALLLLRYQEGLDYKAIGEVTDNPPGTVASRLNRARQRLRDLLKKSYGPTEETPVPVHPILRMTSQSAHPSAPVSSSRAQPGAET